MAIEAGERRAGQGAPPRLTPEHATRFVPPRLAPAASLVRPRLLEVLHAGLPRRATVVMAPAGYGKTTLLAQFAAEVDALVCWCDLDEHDRDARVLLADLVAAIAQRLPGFGERVLEALPGGDDPAAALRAATGLFVAALQESVPDYLVLIVDDCQAVSASPESAGVLDQLLRSLPDHCHVALSGRALPELPALDRLVIQRQVVRLARADLRLTREEAAQVLRSAGQARVAEDQLTALYTQTAGWPIAMSLAATYAAEGGTLADAPAAPELRTARVRLPRKARGALFSFLAAEVLAGQPALLQALLLDVSVLPYVESERAAALLGRPADEVRRLLAVAESRSLFVTRLDERPHAPDELDERDTVAPGGAADRVELAAPDVACYQFHDLFREFLLETLRAQQPVRYAWLQRRAARLAAAAGEPAAAVGHALAGRRFHLAVRLILAVAPAYLGAGRWQTLRAWLAALPVHLYHRRPPLLLLGAHVEFVSHGDAEQAEALLRRAEPLASPTERVEIEILRAAILRHRGQYVDAADLCRRVLGALDDASPPRLRAEACFHLAISTARLGDLSPARELFREAAALYRAVGNLAQEAAAHDGLALAELSLGRVAQAVAELQLAQRTWRRLGNASALARNQNNAGLASHYLAEYAHAAEGFREAIRVAHDAELVAVEACAWLSLGDVRRDQDDLEGAAAAYESGRALVERGGSLYLQRWGLDAQGQLHLQRGELDRAEVCIRQAVHQARAAGARYEEALYTRSQALVHLALGELGSAQALLEQVAAYLQGIGALREAARTHFDRAQVAHAQRRRPDALAEFAALAAALQELGYHGFLVGDARRAMAVVEYGVAAGVGGARLARLREAAIELQAAAAGAACL